jgi:tetratricopeptide (TPR) repeat protein
MRPGRLRARAAVAAVGVLLSLTACVSHLRDAKAAYAEGQELARGYRTARAVAAFKRALSEAGLEARRNPSAQAFMVKGLAEASLGLWRDAETSFVKAAGLGFDPGEAWASDVALLGLAVSFEELGLPDPALRAYENILAKSAFKPVLMTAAQKYADLSLTRALALDEKDKARALAGLVRAVERLEGEDFACGLYHYLHSQVEGHRGDYGRSYEEAVAARELGLPSEKILRDNDNQIVFCFDELAGSLDDAGRASLTARHAAWTKKWGWKDARTPDWKEASQKR